MFLSVGARLLLGAQESADTTQGVHADTWPLRGRNWGEQGKKGWGSTHTQSPSQPTFTQPEAIHASTAGSAILVLGRQPHSPHAVRALSSGETPSLPSRQHQREGPSLRVCRVKSMGDRSLAHEPRSLVMTSDLGSNW